ncbi:hypothetical protein B0H63DRAFT_557292 [Podospora didyma]|uniref:DUF1772-domain-containing protein n=1 Tax=Podospora didyma TaxID=330526 RepID=A0AAE0NZ10_9PEZI|nr:hypothetical protein B0H63DRAFT_557292 [Podospora didyma]
MVTTRAQGLIAVAQWAGIFAPTVYGAVTAQYSMTMTSLAKLAPPKVMGKLWFDIYQKGPSWVLPAVMASVLSNGYLAWQSSSIDSTRRNLYLVSVVSVWFIMPMTFLYLEPGVNGACKWKIQSLLADEGFNLPPQQSFMPGVRQQTASAKSKTWADTASMKELISFWASINHVRWVGGFVSAAVSGYATFYL